VILDVVYNHTAEGNQLGPTLCFRGIDNAAYYRLVPGRAPLLHGLHRLRQRAEPAPPARAADGHGQRCATGCEEMHVDGFRFDLAATLAREGYEVRRLGGFLDIVRQDPVLSRVKLIAEPWDVGEGGYQVGGFPPGWAEWNDRYRDTCGASGRARAA
jgi:isoamylase